MTRKLFSNAVSLIGLIVFHGSNVAYSQAYNIKNDIFWETGDGKPIYSQGGGIFRREARSYFLAGAKQIAMQANNPTSVAVWFDMSPFSASSAWRSSLKSTLSECRPCKNG